MNLVGLFDEIDAWAGKGDEGSGGFRRGSASCARGPGELFHGLRPRVRLLQKHHPTAHRLGRFDEEKSRDFLLKGFEQAGIEPPEEVLDFTVEKLDGGLAGSRISGRGH